VHRGPPLSCEAGEYVTDEDRVHSVLQAQSLRSIAAAEPDRDLALAILNVAAQMERIAFEVERQGRTWRRPLASA